MSDLGDRSASESAPNHSQNLLPLPSRTEAVTAAIERAIFDGVYEPGERLVERDLAHRLGVSKTPVREALKALAGRGLVVANAYRGVRVREISGEMVRNLYGVRLLLEPAAVEESVERGDTEHLHEATAALKDAAGAAESRDLGALVLANRQFHRALSAGSSNALLLSILDDLSDQLALIVVWDWRAHANWSQHAHEHQGILEASAAGDSRLAAERLRAHIQRAKESVMTRFDEAGHAKLNPPPAEH